MTLLKVTGISKAGEGNFALTGISFAQRTLEKIAIAGETGAGKSTLLKIIAGLIQPDQGTVVFEKQKLPGPAEQLVPGHIGIAYLSQHFELQKFLRVEQVLNYSNTISDSLAGKLYQVCHVDHLLKRGTDQLSGGEKQRVAICRLLISSPRLLLLDEPFSHLDLVHKNTLKAVIRDIGLKLKISCMLVSHDPLDTLSWADKIVVMRAGKIVHIADPETVYAQPASEYAGGLFGNYNMLSPRMLTAMAQWRGMKGKVAPAGAKSVFLRPEHFKLVRKRTDCFRAKVQGVKYFGSYRELQASVWNEKMVVKTETETIKEGDTVYLSVSPESLWYV
jgi:ABC-type glutathione transport system ATPase component